MMPVRAVRLHHPTLRNCVLVVLDESIVYPIEGGYDCYVCKVHHIFKAHHLVLDANGDVCVAEGIYELFRSQGIAPNLSATKEVTPRPTTLSMASAAYMGPVVEERKGLVAEWNLSMNGGRNG